MSYYTLFGGYISPVGGSNFLTDIPHATTEFHGSSRSGSFQKACKILLDATPGHELLRFLSAESMTHENKESGHTTFTLITPDVAPAYIGQLDSLLRHCETQSSELTALWHDPLGGYAVDEVVAAQQAARVCQNLNRDSYHGEDGESPHFTLAALVTLRATIARVCIAGTGLVYFTWQPN